MLAAATPNEGEHSLATIRFRYLELLLVALATCLAGAAAAQEDVDDWGPAVGTPIPRLEAYDQSGALRRLGDLTGERGLLLFMNRSTDW